MNMSPPGFLVAKTCLSQAKDRRCRIRGFSPWVGKIPQRRKWQSTPVFLPGKSHGRRSLVGHSPRGCKERLSMHSEPHICWCPVSGSCRQTRGRSIVCVGGCLQPCSSIPLIPVILFSMVIILHSDLCVSVTFKLQTLGCVKNYVHLCV